MPDIIPNPDTQPRLQQHFVGRIQRLASKLYPDERSSTLSVRLKELRTAVQARREGAAYDEAEGFAWRRAEWRVRWGLVDQSQIEEALRMLRTIVRLGMLVFERIAWHAEETATLTSMLRAQTGIEVWL